MASVSEIRAPVINTLLGWSIDLDHSEVHRIAAGVAVVDIIAGPDPVIAAISSVAGGLVAICAVGGHHGVNIKYTIIGNIILPTPRGNPNPPPPSDTDPPIEPRCNRI